jgi:hypothetical protein
VWSAGLSHLVSRRVPLHQAGEAFEVQDGDVEVVVELQRG